MSAIDDLMVLSESYGKALDLEQSTVSWRALGDTKKLAAIEAGRDIQVRRCEKTIQWFSDNWPTDAKWPKGVDRPEPARAAS